MFILYLMVTTICIIACMFVGSGLVEYGRKQSIYDIVNIIELSTKKETKKPNNKKKKESE